MIWTRRRNVIKKNGCFFVVVVVRFTHASRILFKQRDDVRARASTSFSSLPFVSKHVFSFSRCRHCNELLQTETAQPIRFLCFFFFLVPQCGESHFHVCSILFGLLLLRLHFCARRIAVHIRCERGLAATVFIYTLLINA